MSEDFKYVLKRVLVGVLIFLAISFFKTRKVEALDIVQFNEWQYVYRANGSSYTGPFYNNDFVYRLGDNASLLAINVYWPSFEGYYMGSVSIVGDPNHFGGNLSLTNSMLRLFVYENGSYSSDYVLGNCTDNLTCTYNFSGKGKQLSSNRFSIQLLINSDPFTNAYIMYPDFKITAYLYSSPDSNVNSNQDIINNQNENTQNIINNQNENTEKEIESQKVCETIDKSNVSITGKFLNSNGVESTGSSNFGITDYYKIYGIDNMALTQNFAGGTYACFYKKDKTLISCFTSSTSIDSVSIPNNAYYFRSSIDMNRNIPTFEICQNGNQAINDTINDSNIEAGLGEDYFTNFQDSNPLLSILMFPINLLQASTDQCSTITLTYRGQGIDLPCGDTLFWNKQYVSNFKTWWNLFVGGLAIYYLCLKLFHIINNAFDPTKDDFEKIGGI